MYSTCLFCNGSLGENTAIEPFPVGQRLAFDPAKGRLWVICRRCERWNLSPLEERWEAIEECERRFRDTRLRMSTENIGLARLREGLELVRIGSPQRPEFAAWRYGDQFGRRRRRRMIRIGVGTTVVGGLAAGFLSLGAATGGGLWVLARFGETAYERIVHGSPRTVVTNVALRSGRRLPLRRSDLGKIAIGSDNSGELWITVPTPAGSGDVTDRDPMLAEIERGLPVDDGRRIELLTGEDAMRAAGRILPAMNWGGATTKEVATATSLVESVSSTKELFTTVVQKAVRIPDYPPRGRPRQEMLGKLDTPLRLALEMAAHEDAERRALEGELVLLEAAWKEAEEIAGIADNLFLPPGVEERVRNEGKP